MQYLVTFTKNYEFWIEAKNEDEAKEKAEKEFDNEMKYPASSCLYDEVFVESLED